LSPARVGLHAAVAKLAYAQASGACGLYARGGSSPLSRIGVSSSLPVGSRGSWRTPRPEGPVGVIRCPCGLHAGRLSRPRSPSAVRNKAPGRGRARCFRLCYGQGWRAPELFMPRRTAKPLASAMAPRQRSRPRGRRLISLSRRVSPMCSAGGYELGLLGRRAALIKSMRMRMRDHSMNNAGGPERSPGHADALEANVGGPYRRSVALVSAAAGLLRSV
jgi:hypothetical protein